MTPLKHHIGKSPNGPIIPFLIIIFSFSKATTILTGAITMIQTRRSGISSGVLHPHHSVLKQIKLFGSDSQALEASTCCCTPFYSVPFCVTVVTPTPESQPLLSCGCRLGCCQHSDELGSEIPLQPYSTSLPTLKLNAHESLYAKGKLGKE